MSTTRRATSSSMDREEAARVLGVSADASPAEARTAFRALIRARHPDRAGFAATVETGQLIDAHRVLQGAPDQPAEPGRPSAPSRSPVDARAEGDSLWVRADPTGESAERQRGPLGWGVGSVDMVMAHLVEAGHTLGDVTYLDRASGLVEIMIAIDDELTGGTAACSLVASLQGRLDAIEVFCTVERLDGHPAPPIAPLVRALAAAM